MIGLDTNVLVRYLAQDDALQAAAATRLIETELTSSQPGFISLVVLVEMCWVLKRIYAAKDLELVQTVADLLANARFQVESRAVVQTTLQRVRSLKGPVGLVDTLISQIAVAHGCIKTVSFDKLAVRSAGMQLLV